MEAKGRSKVEARVKEGNFYEAEQLVKTLYFRYVSPITKLAIVAFCKTLSTTTTTFNSSYFCF
jgi:hypothetical protein